MIRAALDHVTGLLDAAGIAATTDARNITAPGCFVTVTNIDDLTLDGSGRVTGEILAIVRDLGGDADIDNLSMLLDDVLDAVANSVVAIRDIDTAQQATPPSGGKLPAIRFTYTLYL
ncbi:hypothetical protein ACOI93_06800 [Corynebacterium striatum]|uniref:hypothetical protein n=1 Tax=Corynebacterium striatum TaxID=43770 RepID=UPI003B5BE3A3|nr:hypothetical protein [Corynebacterium striatum]HCD1825959.1 hypothetical protein [Corynebacterium striatum]HCD2182115.1 hypothetical protein [Corynebacterium striatum]HCD2851778.1 hypothetical protein [Corynebacterium striatum]HCD3732142.1 hypothetical protein [Corynebacterium striatum]